MKIVDIARLCHEANRIYCESIGDFTQKSWDESPEWQKTSAINGVNFHLNNDADPSASHNEWLKEKRDSGWKYGKEKDVKKKEHPCIVEFNELPIEQQFKDILFKSIVEIFKEK